MEATKFLLLFTLMLSFCMPIAQAGFKERCAAFLGISLKSSTVGDRTTINIKKLAPEQRAVHAITQALLKTVYLRSENEITPASLEAFRKRALKSRETTTSYAASVLDYTGITMATLEDIASEIPLTGKVSLAEVQQSLSRLGKGEVNKPEFVVSAVNYIQKDRIDDMSLRRMEEYLKDPSKKYYFPSWILVDGRYRDFVNEREALSYESPLRADAEYLFNEYFLAWFKERKSYSSQYLLEFDVHLHFNFRTPNGLTLDNVNHNDLRQVMREIVVDYTGHPVVGP